MGEMRGGDDDPMPGCCCALGAGSEGGAERLPVYSALVQSWSFGGPFWMRKVWNFMASPPPPLPCSEQVVLGPVLGQGCFGTTYKATWRGAQVAVK